MADLPNLTDYTIEERERAKQLSPALARYLEIIEIPASTPSQRLRVLRHNAWIRCVLATLHNRASAEDVCRYWSDQADKITQEAWVASGCDQHPLALFAMGKWGSIELNLSSDIDVIFVSDSGPDAQTVKKAREFISLLTESTDFGFCFRVDTDLKPGGRLAPLISSLKQFEDYYWTSGATWERLALVRLRAVVGPQELISSTHEVVNRFVFRRFIDFSLLADLKLLRSQIHSHYPQDKTDRINLKLAPGGIRDIELFIHALQVIHGGKDKSLRTTSTTLAARHLIESKRFDQKDLEFLIQNYWYYRELENRVQSREDTQTHEWSLALGSEPFAEFRSRAQTSSDIVESILGKPAAHPIFPATEEERRIWLERLGYQSVTIRERIPELLSLTAISTKTFQDEELRLRVLRQFIEILSRVALDKDLGVALLIDFIRGTRAKTGFFSLLVHEDRLIQELCILFGCSPYLGGVLASRPELLDSYLYRAQASTPDNFESLLEQLTERRLLNEIVAANQFLQTKGLDTLCSALSTNADEICLEILTTLKKDLGPSEVDLLTLGKWGGRELGLRSDLDFVFVTPGAATEVDHKISRRFLSRLTERHRGGAIFEVDMRLRPSGKAGPLLVSHQSLFQYLKESAQPWERQSYLRARPLSSPPYLQTEIVNLCVSRGLNSEEIAELNSIRDKLILPSTEDMEIKYNPGGLIDVEFAVQIYFLAERINPTSTNTEDMITQLTQADSKWQQTGTVLLSHYKFLRLVEQLYHLMNQHPGTRLQTQDEGFRRVAQILNKDVGSLEHNVKSALRESSEILKHLDLRRLGT